MSADWGRIRSEAEAALKRARLWPDAAALAAAAEGCARLTAFRVGDRAIPVGDSKLGGLPDLPGDVHWPEWKGRPLSFVAQIDLEEAGEYLPPGILPDSGLLSFFADAEGEATGPYPDDAGGWRVLWFPAEGLVRREPPRGPEPRAFAACAVEMAADLSLPGHESALRRLGIETDDELASEAMEVFENPSGARHQLLGFAHGITGDPALDCQNALGGVYRRGRPGFDAARAREVEAGAGEWRLLLELASDDEADMSWSDVGSLYFMLRDEDLRARRFDHAWMTLQSS
jgi:uncharacterized protein YwqG